MDRFETDPLHPFGLEIKGLDLRTANDQATIERVRDLWAEHGALVFRNQALDEADVVRFSAYFGKLEIHVRKEYLSPTHPELLIVSNVREGDRPIGGRRAAPYGRGRYRPRPERVARGSAATAARYRHPGDST